MLTNSTVKKLRARDAAYFEADGDGLKIKVLPNGRKVWYVRIQTGGRDVHKKIGEWPVMALAEARRERDALKAADRAGVNVKARKMTFSEGTELWLDSVSVSVTGRTARKYRSDMARYILPAFGRCPLDKMERAAVLAHLQRVAKTASPSLARSLAAYITRVMNFALDGGIIKTHDVQRLARALPAHSKTHYPAVFDEKSFAVILREIRAVQNPVVRVALLVLAYCFPRYGEMTASHWSDIDFGTGLWTLPAEHTKRRRTHLIPFPRQVGDELLRLHGFAVELYGGDVARLCVFPNSAGRGTRPIGNKTAWGTLSDICETAGVPHASLHGFRHTASTFLHMRGENTLHIEKQLAHLDPNRIRAVYNQYEFLEERRAMLQRYADFLDSLQASV